MKKVPVTYICAESIHQGSQRDRKKFALLGMARHGYGILLMNNFIERFRLLTFIMPVNSIGIQPK